MDLKTWRALMRQRATENKWLLHSGLVVLMAGGFAQALLGKRRRAVSALSQVHRTARSARIRRCVEPYILQNLQAIRQDPQVLEKPDVTRFFGNRLAVLKPPLGNGEKGVLFAMVSDMFRTLHAGMDLPKLLEDYTLVFEPSWSGYCHPELLEYTRWTQEIFILAAEKTDFDFLKRLGSNLVPVPMGPCDWVDPRVAEPYLGNPKEFDIVMNSNWAAWKRHHVLFRMLRGAKRRYKVLLIGVDQSGQTKADVERLAKYFGVADQLTMVEDISFEKVMDLTCRSRVSVLLSLKEGGNRAIPESIFCDLPVVVLSSNVGGIKKNVVPQTGLVTDERDLESAIDEMLKGDLHPREWGLEHFSCFKSSERLNAVLREHALGEGRPWTRDIAGRANSPESKYLSGEDAELLRAWNEGLKDYLR